ncbi:TonB-dependent receptor [Roseateles sp. GG27B]
MKTFKYSAIALALASLALPVAAQTSTEIGKITVTGEGDKLGTGLMIDEDTAKAKSTVTRAQIEKTRSSSNPFQALALLPGVNSSSVDATGLFGGNLRVRGFNSDQMGFTINGAPVNDSGGFAVYPQEYTDSENLCEVFITQGATDTEAPHVGASGGNVGLTTCTPEEKHRVRIALSAGDLNYTRTFLRVDTGKIGEFKGFLSLSKSVSNKWKGAGKADREHVDAGVEYQLGNTKLSAGLLYNNAVNNNFRALTLTQLATEGYYADYALVAPKHLTPVNGTAQNEASIASSTAYYGFALNPFKNYLINAKANIQISPALRVDIEPYFWYGYGTGGVQQTSLAESSGTNRLKGGVKDINGDGDTLDTVMIYRGSVTETHRPGVNAKISYIVDNHRILGGVWFERAEHRQTAPATTVDSNGNIADLWLSNSAALLQYADGSLYQNRNVKTISTGRSVYIQDTIELADSKLLIVPSLSYREIKRDFNNFAAGPGAPFATFSAGADYQLSKTYSKVLPSLNTSYQFTPALQGFVGIAKNMKVPGNFEYFSLANGVSYTNGVGSYTSLAPLTVVEETAVNVDVGMRYKHDMFKGSITAFHVDFKNRIASSFDPATNSTHDYNVGNSTVTGLEVEVGTAPIRGFSAYASGSYTKSTLDSNMPRSATTVYDTAGKQFPDTPKGMAALALQYASGPFMVNVSGKYTGARYLTLVNDVSIGGFTTVDVNAAYQLPTTGFFKNPLIRLNLSNITDKRYILANSGSGSNVQINAAGNPQIYTGAPRFASVTVQSDF